MTACGTSYLPTPQAPQATIPPLGTEIMYWDMGVAVRIPDQWRAFFGAGQLLIASGADATRQNPPKEPLAALRYGAVEDLGLPKTATLEQITTVISGATAQRPIDQGKTSFATLDAFFVTTQDQANDLIQQAIAFRMPDGRLGWAIGLAPGSQWPNFATLFDQMRNTARILRSSTYTLPVFGARQVFADGAIAFMTPRGWVEQAVQGGARLYRAGAEEGYDDGSGLANGPQIVVSAFVAQPGEDLPAAVRRTLQIKATNPTLTNLSVGVNGAIPAAQYNTVDAASGQPITFVAFNRAVQGKNSQPGRDVTVILRWSVPATLTEAAAPALDGILKSIEPWSGP